MNGTGCLTLLAAADAQPQSCRHRTKVPARRSPAARRDEGETSPLKTRVGGFRLSCSGRYSSRGRGTCGMTTSFMRCAYETVSGRRQWPNRDPKQEAGGRNLHLFLRNGSVNRIDAYGLEWKPTGHTCFGELCYYTYEDNGVETVTGSDEDVGNEIVIRESFEPGPCNTCKRVITYGNWVVPITIVEIRNFLLTYIMLRPPKIGPPQVEETYSVVGTRRDRGEGFSRATRTDSQMVDPVNCQGFE